MQEDLAQVIEQTLGESLRRKTEELTQELSAQLSETCRQAVDDAGINFAESLAESVRAIRAEDSVTGIASALVDGAAKFCGRSLLFIHRGDQLLGFRAAGRVSDEQQDGFQKLSASTSEAAAVARAIETLEAAEAPGDAESLSAGLVELLGLTADQPVRLFPVALRDKVLAVLACDAGAAEPDAEPIPVNAAALETLVALAEAWIEAVGTRRKQSAA